MRRCRCNNVLYIQEDWPFKKVLTLTDFRTPYLHLPRKHVEKYILGHLTQLERDHLLNGEQNVHDNDTGDIYVLRLKWIGTCYVISGNWGRVVHRKGLDVGKEIKIRWFNGCLHFSVSQQKVLAIPPLHITPAPVTHHDQWPIRALILFDADGKHLYIQSTRRSVEDHILVHWTAQQREILKNEEQVNLDTRDVDTGAIYVMKLRSCDNYYNLIGIWEKIIHSKGLEVGKEIKMIWANGCLHFSVPYEQTVVPSTIPVIHHQEEWPIKKALTKCDVNTSNLTLPGKLVEDHILLYWLSQPREHFRNVLRINVNARDYDTGRLYCMTLKRCGKLYSLIGKWGEIIRGKGLQVGQEIRVRWDNGYLVFSVPQ